MVLVPGMRLGPHAFIGPPGTGGADAICDPPDAIHPDATNHRPGVPKGRFG